LFEYQNKAEISIGLNELEIFLDEIWVNREVEPYFRDQSEQRSESQRFLQLFRSTDEIRSNKYVGVIQFEGHKINLLPKIFFDIEKGPSPEEIVWIHRHLLWWLSYCRKIKFPSYSSSLATIRGDFFEVLIHLFSKYTIELLSNMIYQQYEEINRELSVIKGRLNVAQYINENLAKGRWHKLSCTYDEFVSDNRFNRTIKYVAKLLHNITGNPENKKQLEDILFILDEVTSAPVTAEECRSFIFNPVFSPFEIVRDYCYLFLSNIVSFDYNNDLKLFAFLLPMEYVFEDFIFGFIEKEMPEIEHSREKRYIDRDNRLFQLNPDYFLRVGSKAYIADAKYKLVYSGQNDSMNGISQSDIYQMITYAMRYNIRQVHLLYPNSSMSDVIGRYEILVRDEIAAGKEISISAHQIPVMNKELLASDILNRSLNELFEEMRVALKERLKEIFVLN
jgi:5-methylcytosine-specific restriction enzyme subunit McrC